MVSYVLDKGYKKFYGEELFTWLYQKRVTNLDEMTNLKKEFREMISKDFVFGTVKLTVVEKDKDVEKDEKEAEKYAKAINKGMRELEDEERKQQHEFTEMLKKQMENE